MNSFTNRNAISTIARCLAATVGRKEARLQVPLALAVRYISSFEKRYNDPRLIKQQEIIYNLVSAEPLTFNSDLATPLLDKITDLKLESFFRSSRMVSVTDVEGLSGRVWVLSVTQCNPKCIPVTSISLASYKRMAPERPLRLNCENNQRAFLVGLSRPNLSYA